MMRKQHTIYNNYNLWEDYSEDVVTYLQEEFLDKETSNDTIWEEIYFQDNINWQDEHERLKDFFTGHGFFMIRGTVQRWNGTHPAGYIFNDFDDMFYKATEDCDYVKIWDENGHFFIKCSHHDGTNIFEIKRITYRAYNFIDKWEYNWNDKRTKEKIHDIVWNSNFLSSLPHYFENVYGGVK